MLASLVFEAILSAPPQQRKKPVSVLCTDTRVEIPAIVGMIEGALDRMRKCSQQDGLNIDVNLLNPIIEESFWVNIIGRGYLPPNRNFRWCTQRMKSDPVNDFVKQRIRHWGGAILHLGARRAESQTRAQTMAGRESRNGLRLPHSRVCFSARGRFGPTCSKTEPVGARDNRRLRSPAGSPVARLVADTVPGSVTY
jgi:DNA sulfur modification protein DndC